VLQGWQRRRCNQVVRLHDGGKISSHKIGTHKMLKQK